MTHASLNPPQSQEETTLKLKLSEFADNTLKEFAEKKQVLLTEIAELEKRKLQLKESTSDIEAKLNKIIEQTSNSNFELEKEVLTKLKKELT